VLQGRVVSGHTAALDVVQEAAVKKGALKAARLAVSGAFHTPLMQPARDALVKVRSCRSCSPPAMPWSRCGHVMVSCRPEDKHLVVLLGVYHMEAKAALPRCNTHLGVEGSLCTSGASGCEVQHTADPSVLQRHGGTPDIRR
jgi:hypothetical protein